MRSNSSRAAPEGADPLAVRSVSRKPTLAWIALALVAASCWGATSARAQTLPRQLIFLPLPVPPGPDEPSMPVRLLAHAMRLPDDRDVQLWRLSWWVRVGDAHRAGVAFDYVGVESEQRFRWGGGAARIRWSSRLGRLMGMPVAIDLDGNLPHGDESLHPLSAKAPALQARARVQWMSWGAWRITTGWWGRRVSPPSASVRIDPNAWFPSGSGVDLLVRRVGPRGDAELVVQHPLGGLPEATWLHLRFDVPLGDDLAVSFGGMAATGPTDARPIDHGFTFGVTWRPAPRASEPESGAGPRL